ncbi:DNA translocase FtsK 4TM domain-containing protein [Lachnospiraceae bacterium 29-84]
MAYKTGAKRGNTKSARNGSTKKKGKPAENGIPFQSEVALLLVLALCIVMFLSNFGIGGFIGTVFSTFSFGLFGMMAYVFPICFFLGAAFFISNRGNRIAVFKLAAAVVFVLGMCLFMELVKEESAEYHVIESFRYAARDKDGGGAAGGMIAALLCPAIGKAGTYVVDVAALIISLVLITERSFFNGVKKGSRKVYETAREDAVRRREARELRMEEREEERRRLKREAVQREGLEPGGQKSHGVSMDTKIEPKNLAESDNLSELTLPGWDAGQQEPAYTGEPELPVSEGDRHRAAYPTEIGPSYTGGPELPGSKGDRRGEGGAYVSGVDFYSPNSRGIANSEDGRVLAEDMQAARPGQDGSVHRRPKDAYASPPVTLLAKGKKGKGQPKQQLQETAMNLQQILKNFGVNVTITDVSCGPSVTRYEMQPEVGVKVSKIVNLADDIKLNLAAADIRIEAPIPGKAAVGIEVPNKETIMVRFRELVETADFKKHPSNLCFTVGKDIGGQPVVADIAKMPHLLIAGATGSGKSVCINTIIMSILFKADPDDVKLILIDPKVVELSVYNGIPHLLIPVVTDPKKAAGALHWAVSEMMDRYQKFSDLQVRDLKGYNQKIATVGDTDEGAKKMPQIVVVVDELADLMMVASKEVEDAICRLAQLARAAGIHLIIATQRPSVDVITGLIKANMPSRIAFSVSSSVDSRTILDMQGAEKLLGNGDMLFYPQGFQKPLRVQGPFVSDKEVEATVEFLKSQSTAEYSVEIEEKVNTVSIDAAPAFGMGGGDDLDVYFAEAGRFLVEKGKGSIGMLQRMLKIGFNRAARIMDQLEEAGVVGPEEGTKARKILMSPEEFERYLEEKSGK